MSLERIIVPVLALLAGALPLKAQGGATSYAPGKSQYRLTTVLQQTREGQNGPLESRITTVQHLSLEIDRAARDTLRVRMVVDSIAVEGVEGPTPPALERFIGVPMLGTMSPRGRFYALQMPEEHAADSELQSLVQSLSTFFATLPPTARGSAGWTDTTDANIETSELDVSRRVITRSRVAGDTSYSGQRAQRIEQQLDFTMSGTSTVQGMSVIMSGTGTGSGSYFITPAGIYLGSRAEQTSSLELAVGEMRLPITQTISLVVQRLR